MGFGKLERLKRHSLCWNLDLFVPTSCIKLKVSGHAGMVPFLYECIQDAGGQEESRWLEDLWLVAEKEKHNNDAEHLVQSVGNAADCIWFKIWWRLQVLPVGLRG